LLREGWLLVLRLGMGEKKREWEMENKAGKNYVVERVLPN